MGRGVVFGGRQFLPESENNWLFGKIFEGQAGAVAHGRNTSGSLVSKGLVGGERHYRSHSD